MPEAAAHPFVSPEVHKMRPLQIMKVPSRRVFGLRPPSTRTSLEFCTGLGVLMGAIRQAWAGRSSPSGSPRSFTSPTGVGFRFEGKNGVRWEGRMPFRVEEAGLHHAYCGMVGYSALGVCAAHSSPVVGGAKFHGRPLPGSGCAVLRTCTHKSSSFVAGGVRTFSQSGNICPI